MSISAPVHTGHIISTFSVCCMQNPTCIDGSMVIVLQEVIPRLFITVSPDVLVFVSLFQHKTSVQHSGNSITGFAVASPPRTIMLIHSEYVSISQQQNQYPIQLDSKKTAAQWFVRRRVRLLENLRFDTQTWIDKTVVNE